ncbi:MAG TPA: ARMT1-like domain-containing protein [Candidatus Krumholzibacteriaceae bacterium]|nr:ARMT1-like domain-containing protein [Candidatus Krumholzibacteriaceae bacterium]
MRTYLDCIPCFFSQALRAGRMAGLDEKKLKNLLDEVGTVMKGVSADKTPPEIGMLIYEKVREITGQYDPYKEIKRNNISKSLDLYPMLKREVGNAEDSLLTAIRIAIAGNVIDFGPDREFNIEEEIETVLKKDFAIFDYDKFRHYLNKSDKILYIGDNAGEAVFDRVLIEEINKPLIYVVREVPVINDATISDALQAGIDRVARIESSGTPAPGTVIDTCSDEFMEIYREADLIISKGQGNYEGLSEEDRLIFFMLKLKCFVIAEDIGVSEGDIVLKGINI